MQSTDLRPTFFTVGGSKVHSGWKTKMKPGDNHTPCDIFADALTLVEIVKYMGPSAPWTLEAVELMRPVANLGVVLVPRAQLALLVGERVQFVTDVDMDHIYIEAGERGVVCKIDRVSGERWLWLEQQHADLEHAQHTVSITPHFDGELFDSIRHYVDRYSATPVYPLEAAE